MKIVAIVQARMGSTRLPNKVMNMIGGMPMIEILLSRLSHSTEINQILLATSKDKRNISLIDHVQKLGYICICGSENDVLNRYLVAAKKSKADIIVRITGDCPLIDPCLVDEAIRLYKSSNADYLSNISPETFPDGLDVEVFSYKSLEIAEKQATDSFDREHVTPYLKSSDNFKKESMQHIENLSHMRWTVDDPMDFQVVSQIFDNFAPDIHFSWTEVLILQQEKPELFYANNITKRNEGATMGKGQKLWKRAKHIIPGGNMLLSKRAEMFLPDQWPAYFSKTKGCRVWDLDENEYIDMSIMGIGTNILGYAHPEVDEAVSKIVQSGNMSTFNCPEEVYLAEKLIELNPWSDMVRFARSGGEANAIAIRISRASSGKDKIAICGYHGWHDWYLSANLGNDSSLDGHLIPGLDPKGVPRNLKNTVFPFTYNNYDELEALVKNHNIGVIKMEVQRSEPPEEEFLEKVRKLATINGIILIFDECTSGFRETFGGIYKKYGVEPDMAIFGKALGNGYAITAVVGRREIMESAQSTFISSTFWTERIGPAAALKTLEIMEREESWSQITNTGLKIRKSWQQLADKHELLISHSGIPSLTRFSFNSANALAYKTLITQEMLKNGYLAGDCVYVSTEHSPKIIKGYVEALEPIFGLIKECEEGRDVMTLLNGDVCHKGFKRLN